MKIFMLGWEFPPFISGGLGTACSGLTKAMGCLGIQVTFILPKAKPTEHVRHIRMLTSKGFHKGNEMTGFRNVRFRAIALGLRPYATASAIQQEAVPTRARRAKIRTHVHSHPDALLAPIDNYGGDMYTEVYRYANLVAKIATKEKFDIIHSHDWMTYPAGLAIVKESSKPLVVQVHSTEFDRSGERVNQKVYDIERQGMHAATKVIAVSNYTRNVIINKYGVPHEKVEIVHNGVDLDGSHSDVNRQTLPDKTDKIVLFLGRITKQKGPEYFLAAAKKVLERIDNTKFVMAGDGDMLYHAVEIAAEMGIGHKVLFTRFLHGNYVDKMYRMADLFVMPSVSEPFGIVVLEALQHNLPVIVSKQSGVAELFGHVLKVDFWDIDQMANKIVAVLKHPVLAKTLGKNGYLESHKFRWEDSAAKLKDIYDQILVPTA